MSTAAKPPRRISSSVGAYLWPSNMIALVLGPGLLLVSLLQRHTPGGLPWQAALVLTALVWASFAVGMVLLGLQTVWLHDDGRIEIRGAGTGFRRRAFHATQVGSASILRWTEVYRSPSARMFLHLKPSHGEGWSMLSMVDNAPFGRGDGAVFKAVLDAIAKARPGQRLPVVGRIPKPRR